MVRLSVPIRLDEVDKTTPTVVLREAMSVMLAVLADGDAVAVVDSIEQRPEDDDEIQPQPWSKSRIGAATLDLVKYWREMGDPLYGVEAQLDQLIPPEW